MGDLMTKTKKKLRTNKAKPQTESLSKSEPGDASKNKKGLNPELSKVCQRA